MATNHHDTGYEELFSYPEFVQQVIEGFAPPDIAGLMDFSTLKSHLHRLGAGVNLDRLESLVEDKDMLAENLENLVKKERLEGRQEGRLEEAREVVRTQLTFKFGEVPDWVEAKLAQADHDQLKGWMRDVLFATSLEEMFKH